MIAIKSELETIKKSNENFASQNIQVESIDISDNFEQTKKVFAKVTGFRDQVCLKQSLIEVCLVGGERRSSGYLGQ